MSDEARNIAQLILAQARAIPDVVALRECGAGRRSVTFRALAASVRHVGEAVRADGLVPGDRCALFVDRPVDFVASVFGLFAAGVVPVLIDPGMGARNVLRCIAEQRPRGLVGIAKAHVMRTFARGAFASVERSFVVGTRFFPGARALHTVVDASTRSSSTHADAVHLPAHDEPAAILYTSGSTGAPKGVVYTHEMLAGQTAAIREMFDIRPGEIDVACFLPFGLFSVAMGMTVVFPAMDFRFPARAQPQRVLEALQGATSAFGSPALWEPFSQFLDDTSTNLPGLKRVLTAGAPVRPQLHERLLRHLPDGDVFTPYGATEALPVAFMSGRHVVAETAARTREGHGTCVGTLAPHIRVKIVALHDEPIAHIGDARELPAGQIGEIVVAGPCVTRAYDARPDANMLAKIADADADTVWHRMGDAGYVDEEGRLWFCGRKSHRVTRADGRVLHSIPVEAVAETLWPHRAALVGIGPRGMQRAVVLLECPGASPRSFHAEHVRAQLNAALAPRVGEGAVDVVRLHIGTFPVDRRHNAKIEREALARDLARTMTTTLAQETT